LTCFSPLPTVELVIQLDASGTVARLTKWLGEPILECSLVLRRSD
jgi:hypothetical protein